MASCNCNVFCLIILITIIPSPSSSSGFLSPLLSPVLSDLCKDVGCGKGKCKVSDKTEFPFQYECECDPGWKQSVFPSNPNNASNALPFLPCVIPNCTLNYSCSEAAAPAPSQQPPRNTSFFDPCHWANCGGGVCNKTSPLSYECHCNHNYSNLFNNTRFPCFKDCSIGGDCSNLGIQVSNTTTPPPPNLPDTGTNRAGSSLPRGGFHLMVVLVIFIMVLAL